MKKHLIPLIALIFLTVTSCEEKIDIEKEKEAIKAVIENESNSYYARDFEQQSKSFLQDESLIGLVANSNSYAYAIGWEEISQIYKADHENNPDPSTNKRQFTNYKIKVHEESAWAVYDETVHNSEGELLTNYINVRFLEKVDGEWKIVYLSNVNTTSYEEEPEIEITAEWKATKVGYWLYLDGLEITKDTEYIFASNKRDMIVTHIPSGKKYLFKNYYECQDSIMREAEEIK